MTREEIKQKYPELYKQKKVDPYSFKRHGGKPYKDLEKMAVKFLEKVKDATMLILAIKK